MQKKKDLKYNYNREEWTCPICKKKFNTFGNNPAPFDFQGKVVCDKCNTNVVIPERLKEKIAYESNSRY